MDQKYCLLYWYDNERNWSVQSTNSIVKPRCEADEYKEGDLVVAKFTGNKDGLKEDVIKLEGLLKDLSLAPDMVMETMGVIVTKTMEQNKTDGSNKENVSSFAQIDHCLPGRNPQSSNSNISKASKRPLTTVARSDVDNYEEESDSDGSDNFLEDGKESKKSKVAKKTIPKKKTETERSTKKKGEKKDKKQDEDKTTKEKKDLKAEKIAKEKSRAETLKQAEGFVLKHVGSVSKFTHNNTYNPNIPDSSGSSNTYNPNIPASSGSSNAYNPNIAASSGSSNACNPNIPASSGSSYSYNPNIPASSGSSNAYNPNFPASSGSSNAYNPNIPASSGSSYAYNPNIPASSGSSYAYNPNIPASSGSSNANNPNIPSSSGSSNAYNLNIPVSSGSSNAYNPNIPASSGSSNAYNLNIPVSSGSSNTYNPNIPASSGSSNAYNPNIPASSCSSNAYNPNSNIPISVAKGLPTNDSCRQSLHIVRPEPRFQSVTSPYTTSYSGMNDHYPYFNQFPMQSFLPLAVDNPVTSSTLSSQPRYSSVSTAIPVESPPSPSPSQVLSSSFSTLNHDQCQHCLIKDRQIESLNVAIEKSTQDNQLLLQKIAELEQKVGNLELSPEDGPGNIKDHYIPSRGIQIEFANYQMISQDQSLPEGYERFVEGNDLAVPRSWFLSVLAKCKGKGASFTVKKLFDGFFEPEQLSNETAAKLVGKDNIAFAIRYPRRDMFEEDYVDSWSEVPALHLSYLIKKLVPQSLVTSADQMMQTGISMEIQSQEEAGELYQQGKEKCTTLPGTKHNMTVSAQAVGDVVEGLYAPYVNERERTQYDEGSEWTDVKILQILDHCKAYPKDHQDITEMDVIIESENVHPGYSRLLANYPDLWGFSAYPGESAMTYYVPNSHSYFESFSLNRGEKDSRASKIPLLVSLFRDISNAVACPVWPKEAAEWKRRDRPADWPPQTVIDSIISDGCHLEGKPHVNSTNPDIEFSFCFGMAERFLATQVLSKEQRLGFLLFKSLCSQEFKGEELVTSNHLKSLFYYACEQLRAECWSTKMGSCLLFLLDCLMMSVQERNIPNYFIPANNMLDHLNSDQYERLNQHVMTLRTQPLVHLVTIAHQNNILNATTILSKIRQDFQDFDEHRNVRRSVLGILVPTTIELAQEDIQNKLYTKALEMVQEAYEERLHVSTCEDQLPFTAFLTQVINGFPLTNQWWFLFSADEKLGTTLCADLSMPLSPLTMQEIFPENIARNYQGVLILSSMAENLCTFCYEFSYYLMKKNRTYQAFDILEYAFQRYYQQQTQREGGWSENDFSDKNVYDLYASYFLACQKTERMTLCREKMGEIERLCEKLNTKVAYSQLAAFWKMLGEQDKYEIALVKSETLQ